MVHSPFILSICPFVHFVNHTALSSFLFDSAGSPRKTSGEEDHEDDEEDDEDEEDLNHQPAVGRDRLKVLEDLGVSRLHVQLRVLHVSVNPDRAEERAQPCLLVSTPYYLW